MQAVKLAKEIGQRKAAKELGIPKNTLYAWVRQYRLGNLDTGMILQTPERALSLNEELVQLRKRVKEQDKEIRFLKEETSSSKKPALFSLQAVGSLQT